MRFEITPVHVRANGAVDFHVEVREGSGVDIASCKASFYVQDVDESKGWFSVLQQIVEDAPDCCQDFAITHRRWAIEGTPYKRRISEWVEYCPHHLGIGFPAYHIGYKDEDNPKKKERLFECTYCGCIFPESRGIEVDSR